MGGIIFKNAGDNASGEFIATSAILGLVSALNANLLLKKSEVMAKTLKGEEIEASEKLKQIRTTNVITNLTIVSTTLARYYMFNKKRIKPAAVLAGIPLGTVEELSMALSDRIVKYRATGGIFLAHQDGGNESLRIICKAWGLSRYIFLIMLDFLFLYGSAKILDLFAGLHEFTDAGLLPGQIGEMADIIPRDALGKKTEVRNPWKRFDRMNKEEGREHYHNTFPIVTKNRVYTSMYLETYDIVESVNNGKNILTCTLFLRKYRPPYPLELITVKPQKKGQRRTSFYRSIKVQNESVYTKLKSLRWADSIMDFGLSALVAIQKWYMMMEYSIYTPEEMLALSFATHLDRSRGVNKGENIGITEDKDGNIKVNKQVEELMGEITEETGIYHPA